MGCFALKIYWINNKTQFCIYVLINLPGDDIEALVVQETRGKISPITGAHKWSIYIFQALYRETSGMMT
jgi:hypothetical protein